MSDHRVEIVPVKLEKHPNADKLSLVKVFGYQCCVNTEQWQGIKYAAFIPPDSLVDPSREEFNFLQGKEKYGGKARIAAKTLRGTISYGLLVPAPEGLKEGDDAAEVLGVKHYEPLEPEENSTLRSLGLCNGEQTKGPPLTYFKYDLENLQKHPDILQPGEICVVTEKLDGENARYVYYDGVQYCGSRTTWKKEYPTYDHITVEKLVENGCDPEKAKEIYEKVHSQPPKQNKWWRVFRETPELEKFCRDNPGVVIYGEIFGHINKIPYFEKKQLLFQAFDLLREGQWVEAEEFFTDMWGWNLTHVPVLRGNFAFDFEQALEMAAGKSTINSNAIREGIVLTPHVGRWHPKIGRVKLKVVSPVYLEMY